MSTRKIIGTVLLVGGILLLVFGVQASQSVASELSEAFTGSPTDRAMWMIIGGAIATIVGGIYVFRPGK